MSYFDDLMNGPKKKGKAKKEPEPNLMDMISNVRNNYQAMKQSPAGKMIGSKIKSYKEKKSLQERKKQTFQDNLRTKRMKKQPFQSKDWYR